MSDLKDPKENLSITKETASTNVKQDAETGLQEEVNELNACLEKKVANPAEEQKELFVGNLRVDVERDLVVSKLQNLFLTENVELSDENFSVLQKGANKAKHLFVKIESNEGLNDLVEKLDGINDEDIVLVDRTLKVCIKHDKPRRRRKRKRKNSIIKKECKVIENPEDLQFESKITARACVSAPNIARLPGRYYEERKQNTLLMGQVLQNEDRTTEYKRGGGKYPRKHMLNDVRRYACAFLNSEGGSLFIGVADDGKVYGLPCTRKEEDMARIQIDSVISKFQPAVFPSSYSVNFIPVLPHMDYVPVEGSDHYFKVLEVKILQPPSKRPSCLYETDKGEVYIRRDGSVQGPLKASQIIEWCKQDHVVDNEKKFDEMKVDDAAKEVEGQRTDTDLLSFVALQEKNKGLEATSRPKNSSERFLIDRKPVDLHSFNKLCQIEAYIRQRQLNIEKEIGMIKEQYTSKERLLQAELERTKMMLKKEKKKRRPKSATCNIL